jgi:hypothetical protein
MPATSSITANVARCGLSALAEWKIVRRREFRGDEFDEFLGWLCQGKSAPL